MALSPGGAAIFFMLCNRLLPAEFTCSSLQDHVSEPERFQVRAQGRIPLELQSGYLILPIWLCDNLKFIIFTRKCLLCGSFRSCLWTSWAQRIIVRAEQWIFPGCRAVSAGLWLHFPANWNENQRFRRM